MARAVHSCGAMSEPHRALRTGIRVSSLSKTLRSAGPRPDACAAPPEARSDERPGEDVFGLRIERVREVLPFLRPLHRSWFRVRTRGREHLPADGPAIVAANHAGMLPFDAAMLCVDAFACGAPPRLLRPLVHPWAMRVPWLNLWLAALGVVPATRGNLRQLLLRRELALVFPEGADGIAKPFWRWRQLAPFRTGFLREALALGVPIVPTAIVGPERQLPVLWNGRAIAARLGLPAAPVTPAFPWLGVAGLIPLPVRYRVVHGAPILPPAHRPSHGLEARLDALKSELAARIRDLMEEADRWRASS